MDDVNHLLYYALAVTVAASLVSMAFIVRDRITSRWFLLPLSVATVGALAAVGLGLWTQLWWELVDAALLGAMVAMMWATWILMTRGRWLHDRAMRRTADRMAAKDGRGWLTMAEIRAEYAQTVLDDARRDPLLDQVLTEAAVSWADYLRQSGETMPMDVKVRMFANGWLDSLSEPRERREAVLAGLPVGPAEKEANLPMVPTYGTYSPRILILAALCRVDEMGSR